MTENLQCLSLQLILCNKAVNTHVILEVLKTISVFLTSLVHSNHGLDLRKTKTIPLVLTVFILVMILLVGTALNQCFHGISMY